MRDMKTQASRRGFIRGAFGTALFGIGGCRLFGGPQKVRLAVVGIMGKGFSDWMPMVKSGLAEIVAWCDADANQREAALGQKQVAEIPGLREHLAGIPFYTDYRRLVDAAGALGIEAMTVSTPDHMHAAIALSAMRQGIHVYVQKPLVRTMWELDRFARTAKECGVITQMGNQGSASEDVRRGTEILRAGLLGDVREVHVWTDRPVWPQGIWAKKAVVGAADPIPAGLDWEAWIGVARMRDYKGKLPADCPTFNPWNPKKRLSPNVYHAFNWRGFLDFGCGAFGDMACHIMNMPFRGLELGLCTAAECTAVEEKNDVSFPAGSVVRLTYAARESKARPGVRLPEVKLQWYDGGQKPSADLMPDGKVPKTGCLVLGSKGTLRSTDGGTAFAFNGEKAMTDVGRHPACVAVPVSIPRCAAGKDGHYVEFLQAIRGEGEAYADTRSRCFSDTEHSIPLMEGILCGVIAQQVAGELKWDAANRRFDAAAANALLRPFLRSGWMS